MTARIVAMLYCIIFYGGFPRGYRVRLSGARLLNKTEGCSDPFMSRVRRRSIETRSLPSSLVATVATLPSISLSPFARLKLARVPACSPLPLAALPSMSLIPSAPFLDCKRESTAARYETDALARTKRKRER
jgi:hypothetical protein